MLKLLQAALDLLYPPKCILCRKLLNDVTQPLCPGCMQALPDYTDRVPKVRFTAGGSVTFFYEGTLRESFLRYKFGGLSFYGRTYGQWLSTVIRAKLSGEFDAVTWVPVSAARRFRRGYDQSQILCAAAAKALGLKPQRMLRKQIHTPPQSRLAHAEQRRANVSNAFAAVHVQDIRGRRILLIDDIVTTGATISECARTLRMAGAEQVVYAAFAAPRITQAKDENYGNQTDS